MTTKSLIKLFTAIDESGANPVMDRRSHRTIELFVSKVGGFEKAIEFLLELEEIPEKYAPDFMEEEPAVKGYAAFQAEVLAAEAEARV